MTQLILHPTAATAVPVTHIKAGRSGKARKVKASRDMTRDDLMELAALAGFKVLSAHTKAEIRAMLTSGQAIRPAAYDRKNAKRREAKREGL